MIKNISIVTLTIFIFEMISLLMNNYRINKNGGIKKEVFKNNSTLKKYFIIFLPIATIINIIIMLNFSGVINFLLLQFFIISKTIRVIKDIYIYENGISCFGKFIKWKDVELVRKIENQGIRVEIEGSYKCVTIDNLEREEELIELIENQY